MMKTRAAVAPMLCAVAIVMILGPVAGEELTGLQVDGSTLVPLRGIAEWLGATVNFDPETKAITLKLGEKTVNLALNSVAASIDGEAVELDAPPLVVDSLTYVPLRFVAEALGAEVAWDAENQTAMIHDPEQNRTLAVPVTELAGGPDADAIKAMKEQARRCADICRKKPLTVRALPEIKDLATEIAADVRYELRAPKEAAIICRLHAAALLISRGAPELRAKNALPWLARALRLDPEVKDFAKLQASEEYLSRLAKGAAEKITLAGFMAHAFRAAMVGATDEQVQRRVSYFMGAVMSSVGGG